MAYWLMKSEPSDVSIDDLAKLSNQTIPWYGVRNYQARNFMRDDMKVGDGVLFYHSSCPEPGVAGLATVSSAAYPDETQFQPKNKYFDPKSTRETPRWFNVDVRLVKKRGWFHFRSCAIIRNWTVCVSCSAAIACRLHPSRQPSGKSFPNWPKEISLNIDPASVLIESNPIDTF